MIIQLTRGRTAEFPDGTPPEKIESILNEDFPIEGEDVAEMLQDPSYKPSLEHYRKFEEYNKARGTEWAAVIGSAVQHLLSTGAGLVKGAVTHPIKAIPSSVEGFVQGGVNLAGLLTESQNPQSPLFRFRNLLTGDGTDESRYQQFLDAREFNQMLRDMEAGKGSVLIPPELTDPDVVRGIAMIADPSMLAPGIGQALGVGKVANKVVGGAARAAGRGMAAVARPLEAGINRAASVAAETVGLTPGALKGGVIGGGGIGALAGIPGAGTVAGVAAAPSIARRVGEVLAEAGEGLLQQPSRIGPMERLGRLPNATPQDRMFGAVGRYGGDLALDMGLRGAVGAVEGAAVGGALGYLNDRLEGALAGVTMGGALGTVGGVGYRGAELATGKALREARAADLERFQASTDESTRARIQGVREAFGDDAAATLMDGIGILEGTLRDARVRLMSGDEFRQAFGANARGVQYQQGEMPAVAINVDQFRRGEDPAYTLGHEVWHALSRVDQLSDQAQGIRDAIVGRWVPGQDGMITRLDDGLIDMREVLQRFDEYRKQAPQAQADEMGRMGTDQEKAAFVADELAAEYLGRLIAGGRPDDLLRGMSGVRREIADAVLQHRASGFLGRMAAWIGQRGIRPIDSQLFDGLRDASPTLNAMLRSMVRARSRLDERIRLADETGMVIRPNDLSQPGIGPMMEDLGLAVREGDTYRWRSNQDIALQEKQQLEAITDAVRSTSTDPLEPQMRIVDGRLTGPMFSPRQLDAVLQSQRVSNKVKEVMRAVNSSMRDGGVLNILYGAATKTTKSRLTGKYRSKYSSGIRASNRDIVPYTIYVTDAGSLVVKGLDLSRVRDTARKLSQKGELGEYGRDYEGFIDDLTEYAAAQATPSTRQGWAASRFGEANAETLASFLTSQGHGPSGIIRDFRLDRMIRTEPTGEKFSMSEDAWQRFKARWQPAQQMGESTVVDSVDGMRIIKRPDGPWRLYDDAGELVGRYDTQGAAEKASLRFMPARTEAPEMSGPSKRRDKTTGRYVGAPDITSSAGLAGLRARLEALTKEGEAGRYWYENSSQAILSAVRGDVAEAEIIAALVAVFSPKNQVYPNMSQAVKAYAQYKAGQKITAGNMESRNAAAERVVRGERWGGLKTNNFYVNLMRKIDPALKQGTTVDMWIMRVFGYNTDSPSPQQYAFVDTEIKRIAEKLGWEPQQVQAAMWVAGKARWDQIWPRSKELAIRRGDLKRVGKKFEWASDEVAKHWRDRTMEHLYKLKLTDVGEQSFDFADALRRDIAQMSWESRPGTTTDVLPWMDRATPEQAAEMHAAIARALTGPDGRDEIAHRLGLLGLGVFDAPGVWKDQFNPSTQIKFAAPRKSPPKDSKIRLTVVDPLVAQNLNTYAGILGILLKQDGVAWHRPFYVQLDGAKAGEANGVKIDIGRTFTRDETRQLQMLMAEKIPGGNMDDFALVNDETGIRVLNFSGLDNKAFNAYLKQVAAALPMDTVVGRFKADGNLVTNNWKEQPNGEGYRRGISEAGRSDLLRWAEDLYGPEVERIRQEFGQKYGWSQGAGGGGV